MCLKIIEKELKEHKELEEILNDYGLTLVDFREACLLFAMLKGENLNIHNIAKQLKALEIIKKKKVEVFLLTNIARTLEDYNNCAPENLQLTQEEYDLLKEVLL